MHICKRKMRQTLAGFLSALLLTSACVIQAPAVKAAEKEPNLKVGILSDAQSMPGESRGIQNFRIALQQMKARNIELLLDAGDVAEQGDPQVWENYYRVFEEVYPDSATRPEYLIVMGNHDYYGDGTPQEHRDTFNRIFHKEATNEHKEVKGYHFINITSYDSTSNYTDEDLAWLDGEIQKAIAAAPNKPVFVIGHPHAADTVYGSTTGWGKAVLNTVFEKYPQVVYFSGHSHYPLDDERSIWQDTYTAIGTSSLNYLEMEPGKDQGIHPEGVDNNAQAMYMELFDDKAEIERLDIVNNRKVKPENWVLSLPLSKDSFTYTPDRADARRAPAFEEGAAVAVSDISASSCTITFDQAKHEDFTHSYRIRVINAATGKEARSFTIFSDFYNGVFDMQKKLSYPVRGLESNTTYRVSVAGIESFGKEGDPIVSEEFTTVDALVFDADFSDGTPKDSSKYKTPYEYHGNLQAQDSEELKQKVLQFDGESYASLKLTSEQLKSLQNGFTVEVVFKLDKLGSTQDVIGNAEQAGFCLEVTPSGNAQFWVYSENESRYIKTDAQVEAGKYYHYVASYDGENVTVTLDGKQTDSSSMTGKMALREDVTMALGTDPAPNGGTQGCYLNGSIAKVKIESCGSSPAVAARKYAEYRAKLTGKDPSVILDLDLSGDAPADNSVHQTEAKPEGAPKVEYSDLVKQKALILDGSSYVNFFISPYQMEQFQGVFTLETVFWLDSLGKTQDIFADTEYGGVCLEVTPDGNAQLWVWSQELGDYVITDTMVEAGKPYHYLATYDGTALVVYLNGQEVDRKAMTGSIKHPDPAAIPVCLGGDPQPNGTSRYLMTGGLAKAMLQGEPVSAQQAGERYQKYMEESGQTTPAVDKDTLEKLLKIADAHVSNGNTDKLTPSAKEQYLKALSDAHKVFEDEKATQQQVDKAWETLMDVIQGLGFVQGEKDELQDQVAELAGVSLEEYQDGPEKVAYVAALAAANALLADENALQIDLDAALQALKDAFAALVPVESKPADKTELNKVIEKAKHTDLEKYVDDKQAKEEFQAALKAAEDVAAKADATQGEVTKAKDRLLNAMAALRLRADKSILEEWLQALAGLDLSKYTEESANAVRACIDQAQELMARDLSEEEQGLLNDMVTRIQKAYAALVPVSNETSSTPSQNETSSSSSSNSASSQPGKPGTSGTNTPQTGDPLPLASMLLLAASAGGVLWLRKRNK